MARHLRDLVTVIVPFFRGRWLRETVQSILHQRYPEFELFLVDDASTDGSWEIARSFSDRRIRCFRYSARKGKAAAINGVLPQARGEWLTFFDHDDRMTRDSLRSRVNHLKRRPDISAVLGRVRRLIDEWGDPFPARHPACLRLEHARRVTRRLNRQLGRMIPELFVFGACPFCPLSVTLMRREALSRVGKLNERIAHCEDRDYLMRLAHLERVAFLDAPVLDYRIHSENSSSRKIPGLTNRLRAGYSRLKIFAPSP